MAAKKTYSISQAVNLLKEEFPDLTVSKIRFLEAEGLIKPARKPSGYRIFTDRDIEQLKKILLLQKEYYLPLKVIKEKIKTGDLPELAAFSAEEEQKSLDELDADPELLEELEKFGFINPTAGPQGRTISPEEAAIIEVATRFRAFGLEPRHLRILENIASREAIAFEQILFPMLKQKPEEARRIMETLINLSLELHKRLIRKSLRARFPELFG